MMIWGISSRSSQSSSAETTGSTVSKKRWLPSARRKHLLALAGSAKQSMYVVKWEVLSVKIGRTLLDGSENQARSQKKSVILRMEIFAGTFLRITQQDLCTLMPPLSQGSFFSNCCSVVAASSSACSSNVCFSSSG